MGGSMGGVFSGDGGGTDGAPTFLQKLVQGTAKGTLQGAGNSMQGANGPRVGGPSLPAAPSATPVDASFFTPNNFQQPQAMRPNAFYGG